MKPKNLLVLLIGAACIARAQPQPPAYSSLAAPPISGQARAVLPMPDKDWTQHAVATGTGTLTCLSGDCKDIKSVPFGTGVHSKLADAAGMCSDPLIRAVYWQDYFHQFESKAHFDNCAFDESLDYLMELLDAVGAHISATSPMDTEKVMFTLGQALHAIQDFYAHTDYVERMEERFTRFREVPLLAIWTAEGRAELQRLRQQGMSSGEVWWGVPKRCPAGAQTHGTMSKDNGDSGRGAEASKWPNWSRYDAARRLASEATERFLRDAYARWPSLGQACREGLVYVVNADARRPPTLPK